MAKIHLDRIKDRYPPFVAGEDYRGLMTEIIANNHGNIQRAVGRLTVDHFQRAATRIKRSTTKQISVPGLEEVLPKRSVYLRKGAEQGQILSDSLRDKLTGDLRGAVKEYLKTGTGMQYRRGDSRGQINPKLVATLQQKMTETFSAYTKPDATGIPPNIRAIAETEARSAIDDIKHTWATRLEERNPGRIRIMKIWRHHPGLSKEPRGNHALIDGQRRPLNSPFLVPTAKRGKGGWAWGIPTLMQHPHDPSAPIDQIISCHCECDYVTEIL